MLRWVARYNRGSHRALKLQQGEVSRFSITQNGNGTDLRLDPDALGKVVVKGGMGLDHSRIDTANTSLELVPALDHDIVLEPTGYGTVLINSDLTLFGSTVATRESPLVLKPFLGQDVVLDTGAGGLVEVVGPLNQSGGHGSEKVQGNV